VWVAVLHMQCHPMAAPMRFILNHSQQVTYHFLSVLPS